MSLPRTIPARTRSPRTTCLGPKVRKHVQTGNGFTKKGPEGFGSSPPPLLGGGPNPLDQRARDYRKKDVPESSVLRTSVKKKILLTLPNFRNGAGAKKIYIYFFFSFYPLQAVFQVHLFIDR
jgi:hypothetical protein